MYNPPHSFHFGRPWNWMIGIARRISDVLLLEQSQSRLSNETLVTFLAEVSAIVNARPLVSVLTDPECWDITVDSRCTKNFDSTSYSNPPLYSKWRGILKLRNVSKAMKHYFILQEWHLVIPGGECAVIAVLKFDWLDLAASQQNRRTSCRFVFFLGWPHRASNKRTRAAL